MEGLQQQRARKKVERKEKLVYKKYAKIEAAKQKASEWEASAEGQAQLAQEAEHSKEAAAVIPGGSERRKLLLDTLAARGLKLRLDSRLCNAYTRNGVGNADAIADTMAGMKRLFDNTDYSWRSAQATKEVREARSEHYACFGDEPDDLYPEVDWDCEMSAANEKANRKAIACWFSHYSKLQSQMPAVPTGLIHFVPGKGRH